MQAKIALPESIRTQLALHLSLIFADTYVLYTKTQNFHWNMNDPRFYSLFLLLKNQYKELAEAIEDLAERIRILGERVPCSMKQIIHMTSLKEQNNDLSANEMLQELLDDHETLCGYIRERADLANKLGDEGTANLLIQRLRIHEKCAWMLQSHLVSIPV